MFYLKRGYQRTGSGSQWVSAHSKPHISTKNKFHYSRHWTGQSGYTVQKPNKCICFLIWKMKVFLQVTTTFSCVHIPSSAIKVDLSEFWISLFICILNVHGRCFTPPADSMAHCAGSVAHPLFRNWSLKKYPLFFKDTSRKCMASLVPLLDPIPKRKKDGRARLSFCISLRTASVTFLKVTDP